MPFKMFVKKRKFVSRNKIWQVFLMKFSDDVVLWGVRAAAVEHVGGRLAIWFWLSVTDL